YQVAHGIDDRAVRPDRIRKSVGAENTYPTDLDSLDDMQEKLLEVAETVERRLHTMDTSGRTITLKVRYSNFEIASRSITLPYDVQTASEMHRIALSLLPQTEVSFRPVRLLGITVSRLSIAAQESPQLSLD